MRQKDRRRAERKATHIPAYIIAGREVYSCTIKNLSECGFFLETGAALKPGADISMVYQSPEAKKETKPAKILRVTPSGMGGYFEPVNG